MTGKTPAPHTSALAGVAPNREPQSDTPLNTGDYPANTHSYDNGPVVITPPNQSLQSLTRQSLPTEPEKIRARSDATAAALSIAGSDLASYAPPLSNEPLSLCDLNQLCGWLVNELAGCNNPRAVVDAVKLVVETNQIDKKGKAGKTKRGELGDAMASAILKASAEAKAARALELDEPLPDEKPVDV